MKYQTGTFTSAAGAAETVGVGFAPDKVILFNQNAATGEVIKVEWFGALMGDAKEFHATIIVDSGSTADASQAYISSGGNVITKTGSTPSISGDTLSFSGEEGFTVATGFLDTADVCWWEAFGIG